MKAHVVPRNWVGETVALVAAGPSLATFDVERIAGFRTIAIKDGYLKVPHADVLMIGDHRYAKRNVDLSLYKGPLIVYTDPDAPLPPMLTDPRVVFTPKVMGRGLTENPAELRGTFSTTALAINYATLRGAKRIFLAGVDGKAASDGRRWFSRDKKEGPHARYERQSWGLGRLPDDLARLGVEVFNLNPDSAIKHYPFWTEHKIR